MDSSELKDLDPVRLGQWRVLSKLGEGGMGAVYLGERAGRYGALKTVHQALAANTVASERFQRECSAAQRVRSPFVAEIIEADFSGARPYLAIEYVSGLTLEEHIAQKGPLDGAELSLFGHRLATGIKAIHDAAVTHRDIKPSNVIMTPRGPVIIDFGIALLEDTPTLTATNQVVGSLGWTAPEQLNGEVVSASTDIFGWGALMHFAATGRNPFGAGSAQAQMYRIVHGTPDPHSVPGDLGAAISRSLDRVPADRPTIKELLVVTDPASGRRGESSGRETDRRSRSKVGAWAVVALLIAVVGGFGLWQLVRDSDTSITSSAQSSDQAADVNEVDSARVEAVAGERVAPVDAAGGGGSGDLAVPIYGTARVGVECGPGQVLSLRDAHTWTIEPGDVIEFNRGCTFTGPLRIVASGTAAAPIVLTAGPGDSGDSEPLITNATGSDSGAIVEIEGSNVHISDIAIVAQASDVSPRCASSQQGSIVGVALADGVTGTRVERLDVTGAAVGVRIGNRASDNTIAASAFVENTMLGETTGAHAIEVLGSRNKVSGNTFYGHQACGESVLIRVDGGSHNVVSRNRSINDETIVVLDGGDSTNVAGTTIHRNVVGSQHATAVFVSIRSRRSEGSPTIVSHNTIRMAGVGGIGVECARECVAEELVLANNIFTAESATTGDGAYAGGSNLFWAATSDPVDTLELSATSRRPDVPNIVAEPDLPADLTAFVPSACSVAIDMARSVLGSDDLTDALGTAVPVGATADIGAIESAAGECSS